jgi:hypothetical protein
MNNAQGNGHVDIPLSSNNKRAYEKPALVSYGSIEQLTQAGGNSAPDGTMGSKSAP